MIGNLTLPISSPAGQRCVNELWDNGRMFNDYETRERFQIEWRLRMLPYDANLNSGIFEFHDEEALTFFLLRWS